MSKRTISRNKYLQLVGLMTLAKSHNRALNDIWRAAAEITGEVDEKGEPVIGGHTGDVTYGSRDGDPDELLRVLEIEVAD